MFFNLFNVYMYVQYMEKVGRWESLQLQKENAMDKDNIVAGNFNTILTNKEKTEGSIKRDPMREKLEDLISKWNLVDVKPIKGNYT
jgi:hypothetical protein